MTRPALLIVALWAIIAAPVLCTAGVLAHECSCADEAACDHEAECEVDPCSEQIIRKDESHEDSPAGAGSTLASNAASAAIVCLSELPESPRRAPPDPVPPLGAPHLSDLPLLN